jgi:hypothetical protein
MSSAKKMPEGKYGPYIVTDFYDGSNFPRREPGKSYYGRGLLNASAAGWSTWSGWTAMCCRRILCRASGSGRYPDRRLSSPLKKVSPVSAHVHPFRSCSLTTHDMEHPEELYCEVEFWLEDEKYVFDKSFVVYIPENVTHCPLFMRNMTKPVFHFTMGPGLEYNT